jgi:hypothetical protein
MRRGLRRLVRAAPALAVAVAATLIAAQPAAAGTYRQPDRVLVATTGDHSELTPTLAIQTAAGIAPRVVMSLPASALGPLALGDRLLATSELEVTTDCLSQEPRCVGSPYGYDPTVATRLVLAPSPSATGGIGVTPLSGLKKRTCVQRLPNREHHCTFAFLWPTLTVGSPAPACFPASCYVNLVADAYNRAARPGDLLIVGEDEPDGSIIQDKGRVNAVRIRPDAPRPEPVGKVLSTLTTTPVTNRLEIGSSTDLNKAVVFSQRLTGLGHGDQLAVRASMRTDISRLSYNVLVQSKLIVTSGPDATKVTRLAKRVTDLDGELAEANGFNCTQASTPCTTLKAGVGSLRADARDRSGNPVPLYANLVAGTNAKRASATSGDALSVLGGRLRVTRYPASRRG